jgi:hypothetical protein
MPHETTMEECINACRRCAEVCEDSADKSQKIHDITQYTHLAAVMLQCAYICRKNIEQLEAGSHEGCAYCGQICSECADECNKHRFDFIVECALVCQECAFVCRKMSNFEPVDRSNPDYDDAIRGMPDFHKPNNHN